MNSSAFVVGYNYIAVEVHQSAGQVQILHLTCKLLVWLDPTTFIPFNGNWKYLDDNTYPGGWNTVPFNDASWANGNAELGYGDGDEATVVSFGPDANNKYITTLFRKVVNIPNPSQFSSFTLTLVRDDGAIVYINGVEVVRSNMPAGPVSQGTLASSNIGGAEETKVHTVPDCQQLFCLGQ